MGRRLDPAAPWRTFLLRTALLTASLYIVFLAMSVALDPYDTGIGLVRYRGAFAKGARLAQVSRLHDEAFDSAIIGNSHIMSLSPQRLSALTGRRFVMLGVPGTGVPEQMTILDAYLSRHSTPKALVIAVDPLYCLADPHAYPPNPFPDWLYSTSRVDYLLGLSRFSTIQALGQRVGLLLRRIKPQPPDGTFDLYEGEPPNPATDARRVAAAPQEDLFDAVQNDRPGLDLLRARLKLLEPQTQVALVLPPVATRTLPSPGTAAESALDACKAAISTLIASHPATVVLDWHRRRPGADIESNFRDATHYYEPLAKAVEDDIARGLLRVGSTREADSH